ncbi:hypothetical protein RRF57_004237 [Xylaria bambusicola]|uniref:lytic cellulose monooxygenase (C4-dehydrogenating) n=1 Tax=Xylaria bambusicola TaxID=326684 RepID=A0AAN7Z487_9PEZI
MLLHHQMRKQLSVCFAVIVGLTAAAGAHTVMTTLFIDNVKQGEATCVRMPMNPSSCTSPVESITSDDMACGVDGQTPVALTCPAQAGGKLTFQFREWANAMFPGARPCAMYAKQVHDITNDEAAGPGWIKLWDEGYDTITKKWCTERLIDNNGLLSFEIPRGLPSGYWLFRPELLSLHEANKGDPQFYIGCAQIFVKSSNTAPLQVPRDQSVSIPGHVSANEVGLTFNIYAPSFPYPPPGPKAFAVPLPKNGDIDTTGPSVPKQTQGVIPANYIVKNANWVGMEVPDWTDEGSCWAASANCWDQVRTCYDEAPPTGDAGCVAMEKKCYEIEDACNLGDFQGPPNKGKVLTVNEVKPPANIPPAVNV